MVLLHSILARPLTGLLIGFWAVLALPGTGTFWFVAAAVWWIACSALLARDGVFVPWAAAPLVGCVLGLLLFPTVRPPPLEGDLRRIEGRVCSDPRWSAGGWPWVEVALEAVETPHHRRPARGRLRLQLRDGGRGRLPVNGSRIVAVGRLLPEGGLFLSRPREVSELEPAPGWQVARSVLHAALRERLANLRGRAGPLATALLLGQGDELTQVEKGLFRDAGASPLLALSGLHLGALALLFRLLVGWGTYRRLAELIVALALTGFVLVVGPLPSLVRALVFWVGLHAAAWLRWEVDPMEVTAVGAVALLGVFPQWATSPSFVLSVGAMFGLLLLSRRYEAMLRPGIGARAAQWLAPGLAAGASTGAFSLVLFGGLYPQSVVSNALGLLPVTGFLYGAMGYLFLGALPLPPGLVAWVGYGLEAMAEALFGLMGLFARFGILGGVWGWSVWALMLTPVAVSVYRYLRYDFLLRFPRSDRAVPGGAWSGSPKALGTELPSGSTDPCPLGGGPPSPGRGSGVGGRPRVGGDDGAPPGGGADGGGLRDRPGLLRDPP